MVGNLARFYQRCFKLLLPVKTGARQNLAETGIASICH